MSLEDKVKMAESVGKSDHSNILKSPEDIDLFTSLITRLKGSQVKTIGINFPVSSYYFGQLQSTDKDKVQELITSLNLSKQLEYTTYFESIEAFKDPDHLKEENVKVLVQEMNKDLAEWFKLTK